MRKCTQIWGTRFPTHSSRVYISYWPSWSKSNSTSNC